MQNKLHVRKGDLVQVLSGEDKGKSGKILEVLPEEGPGRGRRDQHH